MPCLHAWIGFEASSSPSAVHTSMFLKQRLRQVSLAPLGGSLLLNLRNQRWDMENVMHSYHAACTVGRAGMDHQAFRRVQLAKRLGKAVLCCQETLQCPCWPGPKLA